MSDFATITLDGNTGTDGSPVWTSISPAGSGGAEELRWTSSSSGATTSTSSAAWPIFTRPGSVLAVNAAFLFSTDTTGQPIATYDGSNTNAHVLRLAWDNLGTYASAPQVSAFGDSTMTAPAPGTQPGGQSGSPIVNGSSDTGNHSYLKANFYGQGVTSAGVQETPAAGSLSTPVAATDGTSGAVTPGSAAWIPTHWQDLQGWVDYILNGGIPAATTAGYWYFSLSLWTGPGMSPGTLEPVLAYQYNYT